MIVNLQLALEVTIETVVPVLSAQGEYADHTRQASEVRRISPMLRLQDDQVDAHRHHGPLLPVMPTTIASRPNTVEPTALQYAIQRWQPDADCIVKGGEYAMLMLRCWAAAGLSDRQMTERILRDLVVSEDMREFCYDTAAIVVARHCARVDMTLANIIAILAHLAVEIPCWPSADEIAAVAQAAVTECT